MFKMLKGFLYGAVIGLFSGTALYLLASSVFSIAHYLPVNPAQIFYLIFGASITAGVSKEYADWLSEGEETKSN